MKNKLGLVCLLSTQQSKNAFTGITSAKKANPEVLYSKCKEAAIHNINMTIDTLHYCHNNGIRYNRITSSLIPFDDLWAWDSDKDILAGLKAIKQLSQHYGIELTIHPSQFTILSSEKQEVVENSINILNYHHKLTKLCGIKHIIIHLGSAKEGADSRFIDNYLSLPSDLQSLLRLENCPHHSINDIILIKDLCGIDIVYDLHHQTLSQKQALDSTQHIFNLTRVVGRNVNKTICHISSGKSNPFDNSHDDFINDTDKAIYSEALKHFDVIVEVEAKKKELAIKNIREVI